MASRILAKEVNMETGMYILAICCCVNFNLCSLEEKGLCIFKNLKESMFILTVLVALYYL
jgi:hypothetical protein